MLPPGRPGSLESERSPWSLPDIAFGPFSRPAQGSIEAPLPRAMARAAAQIVKCCCCWPVRALPPQPVLFALRGDQQLMR